MKGTSMENTEKAETVKKKSPSALKRVVPATKDPQKAVLMWKMIALGLLGVVILLQAFTIKIQPKFTLSKKKAETTAQQTTNPSESIGSIDIASLKTDVVPEKGVELPIVWGELGKTMIRDGVIDEQKFRALFKSGFTPEEETMLTGNMDGKIVMNEQNSRYLLDLLWAFGLANKNEILEKGEMADPKYGGAGKFASTGGWSLSSGASMDHYSKHAYITLTKEQQDLVDSVSRGIFRPCCGNSTHFPDCNHGMAMLGLLQLLASNGVSEQEMYRIALLVNSYWFPQTYIDLATYFKEQGQDWKDIDPKTVLDADYSSSKGYQQTRQKIQSLPKPQQGGGGCGV